MQTKKKFILSLALSLLLGGPLLDTPIFSAQAATQPAAVATAVQETNLSAANLYNLEQKGLVLSRKDQDAYIRRSMSPQDDFAAYHFTAPQGWKSETYSANGVRTEHFTNPKAKSQRVLLELHGGGYTQGLTDKHRLITARVGQLIDAKDIYLADYRLAPKNTYPTALNDAVNVYQDLLKRGTDAKEIVVYGDSAGGNLALELSLYLKEHHIAQPGALVLASPWTNLRSDSPSWQEKKSKDLILGEGTPLYEEVQKSSYAGKLSYDDPRLSPVNANLSNLPPMLIQLGGDEVFLDDGVRLARKAAADDTPVTVSIYPAMSHDFALVVPNLEQSRQSLLEIRDFVTRTIEK